MRAAFCCMAVPAATACPLQCVVPCCLSQRAACMRHACCHSMPRPRMCCARCRLLQLLLDALWSPIASQSAAVATRKLCDACGMHMRGSVDVLMQLYSRGSSLLVLVYAHDACNTMLPCPSVHTHETKAQVHGMPPNCAHLVVPHARCPGRRHLQVLASGVAASALGQSNGGVQQQPHLQEEDVQTVMEAVCMCVSRWVAITHGHGFMTDGQGILCMWLGLLICLEVF